jgi:hypothetical protein
MRLADAQKNHVQAQLVASREQFERASRSGVHLATITELAMNEFDIKWAEFGSRMKLVAGKELFTALNAHLQTTAKVSISASSVVEMFAPAEITGSLYNLLHKLNEMCAIDVPEQPSFMFESA